ncbi:amp dependent CoA ligase [Panus rudis PR-1116 ss-1]|nr:amp dependent CoA ligase [Panus rudis PR-1116 ss-1]
MHLKSLFPPVPPIPDQNIFESFFNNPVAELPGHTLYIDAESKRQIKRKEFNERVRDGATALGAPVSKGGLGLSDERGDVVGIFSTNCIDYINLIHSLFAIRTPFSLISAYSTQFELVHALRTSKCTALFTHPSMLKKALRAAHEVGLPESRIFILEGSVEGRRSLDDWIQFARQSNIPREPVRPAKKDTLAYLVFSSGTSGLPKAVMISHGNLWFTMQAGVITTQEELKVMTVPPPTVPPVFLAVLPFYHTYGLNMFCYRPMFAPMTSVIVSRWKPDTVIKAIERYRINVVSMVPSMMHQLLHSDILKHADLSSVVSMTSGAAYLPPQVSDAIVQAVKNVARVTEGYGMSECTLSAIRQVTPGMLGRQHVRGSTGILLPGMEARLLRPDGSCVEVGEPGELWLKGGNIALGYFGNEKATNETFIDGWLRTGDTFKTDGDGNFLSVDPFSYGYTLKISGAQVSPTEIEDVLLAHPDKLISDVCVAGVSGGRTSDEKVPRAWLVLSNEGKKRGEAVVLKELTEWVDKSLSSYKRLRGGIEVVSEIPKSPTGKVLRRRLQDQYEQSLTGAKAKL